MKVVYDPESDTITITLRDERIKESDELSPGVICDYGFDGKIIGLEILDASKIVKNVKKMEFAIAE
jgi:uncharacterized protein YuzE